MAVVSRTLLKQLIKDGDIVVHPYCEDAIGNCSIDVRLGEWFFVQNKEGYIYPYNDELTKHPWYEKPRRATMCGVESIKGPVIRIDPGEMILATTEEFIGSRKQCTTMAKTKSTVSRLGLDCCASAGWGDIGYINRWAFPIHNRSNKTIFLHPGTWIAQIIFLTVSSQEDCYTGTYQTTTDIDQLVKNWDPTSVLPKTLKM